ncbi:MAG TPA: N-acetylmuramic acid 6-phosphate etherase [Rhizobiaceae bacterium]|nr:N-acetylmuramic acid 6-phosphate etherase [Rhizobiaceae bacterium]
MAQAPVSVRTEQVHSRAKGLDVKSPETVLRLLADAQIEAAASAKQAVEAIIDGAERAATCLRNGGNLAYCGAGSSGLMALADALELPGTYGIPRDRIKIIIAGGNTALSDLAGAPEDDTEQAATDVARNKIGKGDCLIAVSASGSTPYAVAAMKAARAAGAETIAIANNAGAPMFAHADVAVLLATPPEMIAGSTRMGAGTAQKIALNMLSTLTAIQLGHVHDGYMVNLHADNMKLKGRAARIVSSIAKIDETEAAKRLEESGGSVKAAVLIAKGVARADAAKLLDSSNQNLRRALSSLDGSNGSRATGSI